MIEYLRHQPDHVFALTVVIKHLLSKRRTIVQRLQDGVRITDVVLVLQLYYYVFEAHVVLALREVITCIYTLT